jgi:cytochrome b
MGAMNHKYLGYAILAAIAVLAAWAATTAPAPFLLHH